MSSSIYVLKYHLFVRLSGLHKWFIVTERCDTNLILDVFSMPGQVRQPIHWCHVALISTPPDCSPWKTESRTESGLLESRVYGDSLGTSVQKSALFGHSSQYFELSFTNFEFETKVLWQKLIRIQFSKKWGAIWLILKFSIFHPSERGPCKNMKEIKIFKNSWKTLYFLENFLLIIFYHRTLGRNSKVPELHSKYWEKWSKNALCEL